MSETVQVFLVLVVFVLIGAGITYAVTNFDIPDYPLPASTATVAEDKPLTKTRCDFTGWGGASIIEEEAANGYRFDGRVNTFFCGEGGLSFHLEEK